MLFTNKNLSALLLFSHFYHPRAASCPVLTCRLPSGPAAARVRPIHSAMMDFAVSAAILLVLSRAPSVVTCRHSASCRASSSKKASSLTPFFFLLSLLLSLLCVFTPLSSSSSSFALAAAAQADNDDAAPPGLVHRIGGRFVLDGSTFLVAGANCYYLAYSNAAEDGSFEHEWVEEVLDEAQSLSLNVLRVWAFQDQWWERDRALQPAPGVYNERFLIGLDKLIVYASERGIKLLLCLTNYWEDYGEDEKRSTGRRRRKADARFFFLFLHTHSCFLFLFFFFFLFPVVVASHKPLWDLPPVC